MGRALMILRKKLALVSCALLATSQLADIGSTRQISMIAAISVSEPEPFIPGGLNASSSATVGAQLSRMPLRFEANAGQWDKRVRFVSRGSRTTLLLTDDAMTIDVQRVERLRRDPLDPGFAELRGAEEQERTSTKTASVTLRLVGAKPSSPYGENELITKSNFFLGSDSKTWRVDVPNYEKVRTKNWVSGVDVLWHGGADGLEYDLEVKAGVDPRSIRLSIDGADKIKLVGGNVEISTRAGVLVQKPPRVTQGGRVLQSSYVLTHSNQLGIALDKYDCKQPLLIDPVLTYSTYLGGSGSDQGNAISVDASGNAYLTGVTTSGNFPTHAGFQSSGGGGNDVFVSKLNAAGTALVYSTYLGGAGSDHGPDPIS
jgi:hypothetical protein